MKNVKDVQKVWFCSTPHGVKIFIQYETIVGGKKQIGTESRSVTTHTGSKNFTEITFRMSEGELATEVAMWLSMFESPRQFQVIVADEEIFLFIGDVSSPMTIVEIVNEIHWATMLPSEKFIRSHYGLTDLDVPLLEAINLRDEQLGGGGDGFGSSTLRINDDYVMWSSASRGGHLLFKKMQGGEEIFGVDMGTSLNLAEWAGKKVVKVSGLSSEFDREAIAEYILGQLSHIDL